MVKMVAMFRFKPGLTREEGIQYYETRHVPLIWKLCRVPSWIIAAAISSPTRCSPRIMWKALRLPAL